ncbi:GTP-binding protein Rit1 [Strongylocentrotus purpuratus]|uniref:small monomeric GTPase n=1 Tax=Strongylocentrotus purpuratus TaxID=7668 RepID=A0A7M7RD58_STRPU|nr:GTP-binding protein Rit1 [Strongylocentrotus purpuratus]|eukprot:XP_783565.2 PREDICTED: GTP-binding protein Rit1 [Strongylocentrotus purpuratus]
MGMEETNGATSTTSTSAPASTTKATMKVYKIVLLGQGGVGKSALTLQFVTHSFLEYHDPTIEDAYLQQAVIDGEVGQLDILDTAGQAEFTAMRDQYMRRGEGFIICYSITDRRSFQEAAEFKKDIERVRNTEDIPIVLVGNKYDLEHLRVVQPEEGHALAREFNCPFFETSAALRHFVDDVFHTLVREIRKKERAEIQAQEKRSKRKSRGMSLHKIARRVFKKQHSESSSS